MLAVSSFPSYLLPVFVMTYACRNWCGFEDQAVRIVILISHGWADFFEENHVYYVYYRGHYMNILASRKDNKIAWNLESGYAIV